MIYKIFLFTNLAIVIPILIHFFSRRKIKEEFFPSILFLIEREKRLKRYIKFEEILLFLTRILMIIILSVAGSLVLVPFKFIGGSDIKRIYDTSFSMNGRLKEKGDETVNINGIADFEKTFEKYKFGIIVSDMQKINFKNILKKNKRYKYFFPEIVNLPKENNSIIDINYKLKKGLEVFLTIKRKGNPDIFKVKLFLNDKEYSKMVYLNEGENIVTFLIEQYKIGYNKIVCMIEDELKFDNVYYKSFYIPKNKEIKILSDEEPEFLIKALKSRFKIKWIKDIKEINKDDFLIIDNTKKFLNIDYLSKICSKIILSIEDSLFSNEIEIKKINDRYADIEDEDFNIYTKEPIKYNYIISGEKPILKFKNGDIAILKKKNVFVSSFPLQSKELIYHTYYISFLYSLIERALIDFDLNLFIGDTISGDLKMITTPDGIDYFNLKEFYCEKIGFYKIITNVDTIFVSVNIPKEEYDLSIIEKERMDYIFGKKKLYDGTNFFLLIFLLLLILEKILERR